MMRSPTLLVLAALAFAGAGAACSAFSPVIVGPNAPPIAWRHEEDVAARADGSVRFFAVGDAGNREADRSTRPHPWAKAVAGAVREVCAERGGCDFGMFLGDNLYPAGIGPGPKGSEGAPEDVGLFDEFLKSYSGVGPLYFVLGNHDWGPHAFVAPPTTARAERQLSAIARRSSGSPRTRGRSHFYEFDAGPAHVSAWDTNYLVHQCDPEGSEDVRCAGGRFDALSGLRSPLPWSIVAGHHPVLSNGIHGNAGSYVDVPLTATDDEGLRRIFERHLIGRADLYLSGHDHSLQVFVDGLGGTAAVVSGAGSKTTAKSVFAENEAAYEKYETLGFALVEARRAELVVTMFEVPKPCPPRGDCTNATFAGARRAFTMRKCKDSSRWTIGERGRPCR
jgi:tartrate-resistant acid phosphatase type 5